MQVRFWGTRGSIATPGSGTVRYGGNTSCVEVRSAAGTLVVLDCGTGARLLGQQLVAEAVGRTVPTSGALLIGHTHWDHIQGLPFFGPLFHPGSDWHIYGPRGLGQSLGQTLAGQMQYHYFPVTVEQLGAAVTYHDLVEGSFTVGDLTVSTQYLNHPALTVGYRIEGDGVTVAYVCDHEPFDPDLAGGGDLLSSPQDARHVAFLADADFVIHDTQYLSAEYAAKQGWGHSTVEYAVDVARLAGVGHLALTHHDPARDDAAVDALLASARGYAARRGFPGTVDAAAEGTTYEVHRSAAARTVATPRAASATYEPAVADLAASVLVASADDGVRSVVRAAASAEDLPVRETDAATDLADAEGVVVLDEDGGPALLPRLRAALGASSPGRLAVLALTRGRPAAPPDGLVTDWLVWPASIGHVRTKLRAAVLRRACRWQNAPQPPDEASRVRALHALGVLDTPAEERFDRYTRQACEALDVPMALVSLVDTDRQWFKSRQGLEATETPRDESLCAHAILGPDVMQVPNLLDDDRFADNPAATGAEHIRFYAGVPLVLSDGSRIGTFCVADRRPRVLGGSELDELRRLAALVQAELEPARASALPTPD